MVEFSQGFRNYLADHVGHVREGGTESYLKDVSNPIERQLIELHSQYLEYNYSGDKLVEETLSELEPIPNGDRLLRFMWLWIAYLYYGGYNEKGVDEERGDQCFEELEDIFHDQQYIESLGTWEQNYVRMRMHYIYAHRNRRADNLERTIYHTEVFGKYYGKLPETRPWSAIDYNIANYRLEQGQFDKAEQALMRAWGIALKAEQNYLWNILKFAWGVFMTQGNPSKIISLLKDVESIGGKNNRLKSTIKEMEARLNHQLGNYDLAIAKMSQATELIDPVHDFKHFYTIYKFSLVNFYEQKFTRTGDLQCLDRAEEALDDVVQLNPDGYWGAESRFWQAKLLSHGGIIAKGQAAEMLKELVEEYPKYTEFIGAYLELLFQGQYIDPNPKISKEIDELIHKLSEQSLAKYPGAVNAYIHQQLIMSKYHFYQKTDLTTALDILRKTKLTLKGYNLPQRVQEIDKEMDHYHTQVNRIQDMNAENRGRLMAEELRNYISMAKTFVDE